MGGKAKQAHRTKNNARPSSSGRSAELLSSSVKDPAFFGLGTGKPLAPLFPTLTAINLEQGLNTEYALCFKKFNKKDPITRTKALQELLELIKNGNADDVVAALPSWAHFYQIFTVDMDRKVRECAQACHASLVRVAGRRAAPQLRRLLPAWLLAQRDEHAPAQHHAHTSLTSTFPEGKLGEAFSFCKVEIISLLLENLMGNAEAMLSKKIENKEEREIQVSQIIASSLGALELFVVHLPSSHDDWLWDVLTPLLRAGSFWKMVQNTNEQHHIRAAWYGAVGRIMERFKDRFGAEYGGKAARALLGAGGGGGGGRGAAQRWAALLLLVRSVPDWHTWFDKKDLLIKRILDVLENGGWGDARLLSNLLLPLLAHLPQEVLTKDFYTAFFNAMFLGLEKKNVLSSKSERQAWITNLADCVRYLSIQQYDFVLEITTCVHRTWLEKVLSTQESQARNNLIKHSATNMTSLFKFWLKRSQEENSEKYDQLLRNCWQNIGSTISTQIDKLSTNDDEINRVMDSHILLLQNLKTAFAQESKKKHSIKFEGDAEIKPEIITVAKVECDGPTTERYKHNLTEIVENTCAHYFEFAHKNKVCNTVLTSILTLLIEFDSKNLYLALARHFGTDSIYGFYDGTLRIWLLDDAMRCKSLVDVVFLLVKYLSEEEQDCVFNSFEQLCEEAAEWCLALSVSHPHCGAGGGAARWARGVAARRVLLRVCARALHSGDARAHALLLQCVAHPHRAESVLSEDTIEKIVEQLCEAVSDTKDSELERRVRTAAQVAGAVTSAGRYTCAPLARALLALQLALPRGDERLSLDTWLEVRSSWQDAIFSLPDDAKQSLISDIISLVHQHLFNDMDKLDITKIENIVSLLPYVITASDYAEAPSDCSEIVSFTKQLFTFQNTDTSKSVEIYALKCDCIMGNLNCPFDDDNKIIKKIVEESSNKEVTELEKENLKYYTYKCLFKAFYLRTILLRKTTEEDEEECTQVAWCNTVLRDVYFQEQFSKLLYHYMILNTLNERYGFWPSYEVIQQTKLRLDEVIKEIINETSNELRQKLLGFLSEKAATIGYYWSYARRLYEVKIDKNIKTEEETLDKSKTADSLNTSNLDKEEEMNDEDTDDNKTKNAEIPSVFDSKDQTPNTESHEESKKTTLPMNETAAVENIEMEFDAEKLDEVVTGNGIFHSMQASLKWSSSAEARLQCGYLVALRSWLAAHGVLDDEFLRGAALCRRTCSPDVFLNAYYGHKHTMLYERDITTAPWAQVVSNAAVLDFLTEIVAARGWDLPSHHWDFITITLCSLVNSLTCSVHNWGCTKMAMLCRSTLALLTRVQSFAVNVRRECERREPTDHVLALASEWDDIFAPDINGNLFNIIITIMESNEKNLSSGHVAVLGALVSSIPHLQWERIPAIIRAEKLSLARISRAAADALQNSSHAPIKLLAFRVLRLLAEPLVLADAEMLAQWSASEEDSVRPELSLSHWDAALTHLQELVDAALSHLTVCEEVCELVAFSDSHSVALGYLLLSVAAYEHCKLARGDLVHHYIEHYRERKYGEYQLCGALRLLPATVAAFARDDTAATLLSPDYQLYFVTTPDLTVEEVCSTRCVGELACRALFGALGGPGVVTARGWHGAAPPRAARALRRLVAVTVTPTLVREHLALLRTHAHRLPHAHVSIHWSSREARCSLEVEERRVELSVRFSLAHPLEPPRLTAPAYSPAPDTHWLIVYLAYQNGTLLNAFKMWIRAVTARIQSAPQCYICYCRMHPASGRLPTVPCHQCRNKFHAPCLRKWFTTSSKSNCPLCRSSF